MKTNLNPTLLLLSCIAILGACSKSSDIAPVVDVPTNATISLSQAEVYPNTVTGVWGVFHAVRTETKNYSGPYPGSVYDGGEVVLLNAAGTDFKTVAGITLNNAAGLNTNGYNNVYRYAVDSINNGYSYYPKLKDFDAGATWYIYDKIDHLDFQYTDNNALPFINSQAVYNSVNVSSSQPLLINLYAANFANTDSVYIILPTYPKTTGRAYSITAGTLAFTRGQLTNYTSMTYTSNLVMIAYRTQKAKINGKMYAFVRAYKFMVTIYVGS